MQCFWQSGLLAVVILATVVSAVSQSACTRVNKDAEYCFNEKSNADRSLDYCSRAIQSSQLSGQSLATVLNNRGNAYADKGEYDRAIQDYDQAIRLNSTYALAFDNRGTAYTGKKEYDRAIQDHNQAIRLNPTHANAFNNRGTAYVGKKDYDQAIQDYNQAIRLNPTYANAFFNRGSTYDDKGDYDRAIQDYDQAIRLNPAYADAFKNRGLAHLMKDEYDEAIRDYDQAIRLKQSDAGAFGGRGLAHQMQGEYDQAIQDYDQVIGLDQTNAKDMAFFFRGIAQFDKGQFLLAVSDFGQAVRLRPTDPQRVIWLYLAQERAGQNGRDGLNRSALRVDLLQWPGPVVSMYQGNTPMQTVLEAALNPDPQKQREQQCAAYFYIGEHLMIQGRMKEAVRMLRATIETGAFSCIEFASAKAELKRIGD